MLRRLWNDTANNFLPQNCDTHLTQPKALRKTKSEAIDSYGLVLRIVLIKLLNL